MTLPTFIVIGVAKAGTTSLFRYFEQHPQVFVCPEKGTNYFGYEDARDWQWHSEGEPPLLRHFHVRTFDDYVNAFAGAGDATAIGEVSPQYFRCPTAAARIREAIPDVKLIVSLRNPAERAFSGYLMRVRRGERVSGALDDLTAEASHVREGFYYERMKRYFDRFPREQIKVILFDDFRRDTPSVMVDLYEFIGVDATFQPDTSPRHNPANIPRSRVANRLLYHPALVRATKTALPGTAQRLAKRVRQVNLKAPPKLPAELRAELLELYRDDVLQLEQLVDRDLSVWFEGR